MLLRALGFQNNAEIIELFHEVETIKIPGPNTKKYKALEKSLKELESTLEKDHVQLEAELAEQEPRAEDGNPAPQPA